MNKDWAKETAAEIAEKCIGFKYSKRTIKYFFGKRVIVYKEGLAEKIILAHAAPILAENEGLKKKVKKLEDEMEEIKEAESVNF